MICARCKKVIKKDESDSILTFTNFASRRTDSIDLCERCGLSFLEWFASGNYVQKKINNEERKILVIEK